MKFRFDRKRKIESRRRSEQADVNIICMLRLKGRLTHIECSDSPRRSREPHGLVGHVKRVSQAADEMITWNSNVEPG
jgi:hypothetical protein